jgi:hypothetical protein
LLGHASFIYNAYTPRRSHPKAKLRYFAPNRGLTASLSRESTSVFSDTFLA